MPAEVKSGTDAPGTGQKFAPKIAPIDSDILYYVLIGAASLPYVNASEVRLLTGRDPKSPSWIDAHADGLVSILLPGLAGL